MAGVGVVLPRTTDLNCYREIWRYNVVQIFAERHRVVAEKNLRTVNGPFTVYFYVKTSLIKICPGWSP